MRINKMITIEKIARSFIKFSQLIPKGDVWRSVWRMCRWILGLKGLSEKCIGGADNFLSFHDPDRKRYPQKIQMSTGLELRYGICT